MSDYEDAVSQLLAAAKDVIKARDSEQYSPGYYDMAAGLLKLRVAINAVEEEASLSSYAPLPWHIEPLKYELGIVAADNSPVAHSTADLSEDVDRAILHKIVEAVNQHAQLAALARATLSYFERYDETAAAEQAKGELIAAAREAVDALDVEWSVPHGR